MPRYDRHSDMTGASVIQKQRSVAQSSTTIDDAAQALRQAELEAAQPENVKRDSVALESMSVDELRTLANELDIPNRAQITEQEELIVAIRQRL